MSHPFYITLKGELLNLSGFVNIYRDEETLFFVTETDAERTIEFGSEAGAHRAMRRIEKIMVDSALCIGSADE